MPYTKKPYKKPYKKTYKKKSPYVRKSLPSMIKSIQMRNQETKHHITVQTEQVLSELSSPALVTTLNSLSQGVQQHQRIGNVAAPIGMDIRGHAHANAIGSGALVRIMVIKKNAPGDNFLSDGFEDDVGNFAPATADVRAIYSRVNNDKYKVLKNYVLSLTGRGDGSGESFRTFKMWIPLSKMGVFKYDDSDISCRNKDICLIALARHPNNDDTGSQCELSYNSKFYFKDA